MKRWTLKISIYNLHVYSSYIFSPTTSFYCGHIYADYTYVLNLLESWCHVASLIFSISETASLTFLDWHTTPTHYPSNSLLLVCFFKAKFTKTLIASGVQKNESLFVYTCEIILRYVQLMSLSIQSHDCFLMMGNFKIYCLSIFQNLS